MTTALTKRREHLAANRRRILARSIAAAGVGAVPIPLLEEWLASTIKRRTVAIVAESHAVDIDRDAIREIADGPGSAPEWTEVAGGSMVGRMLNKTWRRVLIAVVAARRAQVAGKNFLIATLFDHYCARMHVGLGIDGPAAAELRALMERSLLLTPGGLSRHLFRRAIASAARATIKAPVAIADRATGGAVRRMLAREVEASTEVDEELEMQMAAQESFLSRAALAVELEMSAEANPYVDDVIDTFERLWRERQESR